MLGDGTCQLPCNLALCQYDSGDCITDSQPFPIYVSTSNRTTETGSFVLPFSNLHKALLSVWAPYTVIYLLKGLHSLELRDGATELDPLTQMPVSVKSVTVATLFCFNSSIDHSECANQRAELLAPKSLITLTVISQFVLKDLVVRGDYDLQPGCWEPLCAYCPSVTQDSEGVWTSDQGNVLEEGHFAPQSLCDAYHNFTFIDVKEGANLTIERVTFQHHRQQMLALISSDCSFLRLTEVDFQDIMPMRSDEEAAVIWQGPRASFCGSLIYEKGSVSYLNNGYEFQPTTVVSAFLRADLLSQFRIDSVTFHHNNIMVGIEHSTEQYLLHINDPNNTQILNCSFHHNLATRGSFLAIHFQLPLPLYLSSTNSLLYQSMLHIAIHNTRFLYNYVDLGSLVMAAYYSDHRNVEIRSCMFVGNGVKSGSVVQLQNAYLESEFCVGELIQMFVNGVFIYVFSPPRSAVLDSVHFEGNYGENVILAENIGIFQFRNATFTANGQPKSGENPLHSLFTEYLNDSNIYLAGTHLPVDSLSCSSVCVFTHIYNFSLVQTVFESSYCPLGVSVLSLSGNVSVVSDI